MPEYIILAGVNGAGKNKDYSWIPDNIEEKHS